MSHDFALSALYEAIGFSFQIHSVTIGMNVHCQVFSPSCITQHFLTLSFVCWFSAHLPWPTRALCDYSNSPSGFTIMNIWAKFIISPIALNIIDLQWEEHTFHLLKLEYSKLETIWKPLGKGTFLTFSPWHLILLSVSFQSYPQWNLKLTFGRGRCISSIHKSLLLLVSWKYFWEFFLAWELCTHTSSFQY